ncbi:extracellular solute-binding protein [Paenibacillus marinisediminis]
MNQIRKKFAFMLVAVIMLSLLSACGGESTKDAKGEGTEAKPEQTTKPDNKTDNKPKERLKISMMYPLNGDAPQKSEAWKWMEDKLDVELDLLAIPSGGYLEKTRLTVASGELPDLMVWTTYPDPELLKYIRLGAFKELDSVVTQYPNIMETPQQTFDNVKVDKKLYSIPRTRPLQTSTVFIRKDWLDQLNLEIPKTVEEFADVAVKFTTMDPDQNGKDDTFGIAVGEQLTFLDQLWMAFDAGNMWRASEDGTLENWLVSQGRKDSLNWLANLYKQGAIDKDFPVLNYSQVHEKFIAGKMGIMIGAGVTNYGQEVADAQKLNPKAEIIMIDPPVGPTGKYGVMQSHGFYGHWVINAKVSDEKLKKIMEVLDWQATQDALDFKRVGVEGVHHNMVNGAPVLTDQYKADGVLNLVAHNKFNPYYTTPGAPEAVAQAQLDEWKKIEKLGVTNPAVAVLTPTMQEKMADLEKFAMEYSIKVVTGEKSIDSFDAFVAEWKSKGGEQMTKEVNEWYAKNK